MSGTIIETNEFHTQIHLLVGNVLSSFGQEPIPTYQIDPATLTIKANFTGETPNQPPQWHEISAPVTSRQIEEDVAFSKRYRRWLSNPAKETDASRHAYPLHVVAKALREEIGDELTCKLDEERALARSIAKQPEDELEGWGGLYGIAVLFIAHHQAQQSFREVLNTCKTEDTRVTNENAAHADRIRLARESGNPYLNKGLHIAPNLQPTYPLDSLAHAAERIVGTNMNLIEGFQSEHAVEATEIRPVDQVLSINGLLARPPKSSGDESALSAYVKKLFGGKSR